MSFFETFKTGPRDIIGLDIGSCFVKCVSMRKSDNNWTVTSAAISELEKVEFDHPAEMAAASGAAVCKCMQSCKVETKYAVTSVCGPEVAVRSFSFPSLMPEEVRGAVLLEAQQVCPFYVDSNNFDYELCSDSGKSVKGFLVAATDHLIREKESLVNEWGLKNVLMDVDGIALINAFTELSGRNGSSNWAVLNVGHRYTNFAAKDNQGTPFVRDLPCGGFELIDKMAEEGCVPAETIERLIRAGDQASDAVAELQNPLSSAVRKLVSDIEETLRYYEAQRSTGKIEQIFVCGGFALVPGFISFLNERLAADVNKWDPFEKVIVEAGPQAGTLLKKKGPMFAIAAGLAMRSI